MLILPPLGGCLTSVAALMGGVQPALSLDFTALTALTLPATVTFSRAGLAMQYDSTGNLTYAPNNLLTQSNTFSNAAWSKSSATIATGVADPFGGTSASTLTSTASGGAVQQTPAGNASTNYISAVWMRRRTGTGQLILRQPDDTWIDVTSLVTAAWSLVALKSVATASVVSATIMLNGPIGDAIDIYGWSASAVTYETTTRPADQVITTTAAYYGPRFDYDPSTLLPRGLLIEAAATNVVLQNCDLSNAAWTKTNVTAAKDQTGIDGVTSSASSIAATASNGKVLQAITLASSQRFQSAYVKRITGTGVVNMTTDGGTTWTAIPVTAGWARVSIPAQTLANPSVGFQIVTNGDKIAVDFVANEAGDFNTSPFPTAASSVTRAADSLTRTAAGRYIMQRRSVATGTRDRIDGASGSVTFPVNYWHEQYREYAASVTALYTGAHLTVDGPY